MGIEEEADRTLFIRNLDSRVTEEMLFELFLQAGPLIKTKIPKDPDGKQKTFGFAVYKHEVSTPYAVQLLNGTSLHGRTLHVQFRSGSSHSNSPGNSQNSSPANTPHPHGHRPQTQFNSPLFTLPPQMQRLFSTPDNLQKNVMMNNMMWQLQMQQLEQMSGSQQSKQQQQPPSAGGYSSSRQQHGGGGNSHPYHRHYNRNETTSMGRNPRNYQDQQQQGSGGGRQHGHNRDNNNYHNERSSRHHHDNRGGGGGGGGGGAGRHHEDRYGRGNQDNKWQQRY